MGTLTAGVDGTTTGYNDGSIGGTPIGSFTGTIAGASVLALYTDSTTPDQIFLYTAAGSFSAINGKPLNVDGTIYSPAGASLDLGAAVLSTYTATGFSFVNTSSYTVDVATYAGPTYVGVSTGTGGAGGIAISFTSSGRAADDLMFIAVMTANQAVPAVSGWNVLTPDSGTPSRGTAGAAGGVRCTVLWRVSDGTETTVTIGDSGDIQYAAGVVVRGASADAEIDVSIGGNAAASTSGSFTGVTTPGDNRLVLTFVTTDRDGSGASWSSQANSSLANLAERFDNGTATATGGGVAIYTGEKLVAGATGTTTATQSASAAYCWITVAVKDAAAGNDIAGTVTFSVAPTGLVNGRGNVSATGAISITPTAALIGRGDVSGALAFAMSPTGSVVGVGLLGGSASVSLSPSATISGFGPLSGASSATITPTGALVGLGPVSGQSSLSLTPTASLIGKGAISASSTIGLAPSAALSGIGFVAGSLSIVFSLSATTGGGVDAISGAASFSLSLAGEALGLGDIAGSASINVTLTGSLESPSNDIAGSLAIGFSCSGTLTSLAYTQIINVPMAPAATPQTPTILPGGPIGSVPVPPGHIINTIPLAGQIV